MPTFLDLHILQTLPPSNVNRDETGNPKTAIYGGQRRARVSSQAWKKATRDVYKDHLDESDLGVRTKRAVELLCERMGEQQPDITDDDARARAAQVFKALGIKLDATKTKTAKKAEEAGEEVESFDMTQYLIFWSNRQLDRLATLALSDEPITRRSAAEAADQEHGIDVALFGRMVADAADFNVDATVQVAHAISTHPVEIEQDYFTAVDEQNPESESGAGMIGNVDFDSATLYRYATINVDALAENLAGDAEATVRAVAAFASAFASSMPSGKQNTFANRTVPDVVIAMVRDDQPVNLVGAFEKAIDADIAHIRPSTEALVEHHHSVRGFLGDPAAVFVTRSTGEAEAVDEIGTTGTLRDLVERASAEVRSRLAT